MLRLRTRGDSTGSSPSSSTPLGALSVWQSCVNTTNQLLLAEINLPRRVARMRRRSSTDIGRFEMQDPIECAGSRVDAKLNSHMTGMLPSHTHEWRAYIYNFHQLEHTEETKKMYRCKTKQSKRVRPHRRRPLNKTSTCCYNWYR